MRTATLWIGSVALAGSAFGQAMIERGAAAITGTSAGVGIGKGVGNILKNVERTLGDAANHGKDVSAIPSSRVPVVRDSNWKPAPSLGPLVKANTGVSHRQPMIGPAVAPAPPVPAPAPVLAEPAPVLPVFTLEAMQEVKEGVTRADLVAKVGAPFFKLTVPDGNHAVEIYRYRSNGQDAAVVKLLDGVITSVETLSR